jgi:hypothetical protein
MNKLWKMVYDSDVAEVMYEIVATMQECLTHEGNPLVELYDSEGRGVLWEKAQEWTEEFCQLHNFTVWGEEPYFVDTIEQFVHDKIDKL